MKITFIILCYNQMDEISRTIKSVLYSSIPKSDYEIIVVDDGSTDDSLDIIRLLSDEYENLSYIPMGRNTRNQSLCRNSAIRNSKSEFLAFIDGDDYVDSLAIYNIYKFINENEGYDIYQTSRVNRNMKKHPDKAIRYNYTDEEYNLTGGSLDYAIGICSYFVRKSFIIDNNLLFDEEKYIWDLEDVYFAVRMYDNTDKIIPVSNTKWHYYCVKHIVCNSNKVFADAIELFKHLDYLEDMHNDLKKILKKEKTIQLAQKLFDKFLYGGDLVEDFFESKRRH